MSQVVLLTGFGPFLDVQDNPSARLVRALDGRRVGPYTLVGRELPVSFVRGPAQAVAMAQAMGAAALIGFGVHRGGALAVESVGHNRIGQSPDVDGLRPATLGPGPAALSSTLDPSALSRALACGISTDAGSYVCNAWLYTVLRDSGVAAAFIHIPSQGVPAQRVLAGLRCFVADGGLD